MSVCNVGLFLLFVVGFSLFVWLLIMGYGCHRHCWTERKNMIYGSVCAGIMTVVCGRRDRYARCTQNIGNGVFTWSTFDPFLDGNGQGTFDTQRSPFNRSKKWLGHRCKTCIRYLTFWQEKILHRQHFLCYFSFLILFLFAFDLIVFFLFNKGLHLVCGLCLVSLLCFNLELNNNLRIQTI